MLRPPPRKVPFRSPQPAEARRVWCPSCDAVCHVSTRAISLRCPVCTGPLTPSDLKLPHSIEGEVTVIGRVSIPRAMRLTGRLTCAELSSEGQFRGQARVGGPVELRAKSLTQGVIVCRSLQMEPGARFRAEASIGEV